MSQLKTIRDRVFQRLDWSPNQSSDAKTRVDNTINDALRALALDAPFAFPERVFRLATQPDFYSPDDGLTGDGVSLYSASGSTLDDAWVLERNVVLPVASASAPEAWDVSGRWDGRWIEIKHNDTWYRAQIREVWREEVNTPPPIVTLLGYQEYISLTRPLVLDRGATFDLQAEYRIYTPYYYLPEDVADVSSVKLYEENNRTPLRWATRLEAEDRGFMDRPSVVTTGEPDMVWEGPAQTLRAPTLAPTTANSASTWSGDEPGGVFQYCYTYCWGVRDEEVQEHGPGGRDGEADSAFVTAGVVVNAGYRVLWESPPSPVSNAVGHTVTHGSAGVDVTTPNIAHMLGFGDNTTKRYGRTGLFKRIYRKRLSVDTAGGGTTEIEAPDTFFLIASNDDTDTVFVDRGLIPPDLNHPLRPQNAFPSLAFHPRPDQRYVIDVRATARLNELTDDYDQLGIHDAFEEAVIEWVLSKVLAMTDDPVGARQSEVRYEQVIKKLARRFGPDLPGNGAQQRRMAMPRRRRFRKWY